MKDNCTHPTADEIYERAREINPHISRGTVYRNLALLSKTGEILKIRVPDGSDHYDSSLHEHYHFCCKSCGKMHDVPGEIKIQAKKVSDEMAKDGFTVDSHSLIFTGLCPSCNAS